MSGLSSSVFDSKHPRQVGPRNGYAGPQHDLRDRRASLLHDSRDLPASPRHNRRDHHHNSQHNVCDQLKSHLGKDSKSRRAAHEDNCEAPKTSHGVFQTPLPQSCRGGRAAAVYKDMQQRDHDKENPVKAAPRPRTTVRHVGEEDRGLTPSRASACLKGAGDTYLQSPQSDSRVLSTSRERSPRTPRAGANDSEKISVAENERRVVEILQKDHQFTDAEMFGKKGHVYAVFSAELQLVKIGWTVVGIQERVKNLQRTCGNVAGSLEIVRDEEEVGIYQFKRLEKVIHADLGPHRVYFECKHGSKKDDKWTEHREWFNVPKDVAMKTVRFWRNFFLEHPYGDPAAAGINQHSPLQVDWKDRLKKRAKVSSEEEHDDHDLRMDRWKAVLEPKASADFKSKPARMSNLEATARSTEIADVTHPSIGVDDSTPERHSIAISSEQSAETIRKKPMSQDKLRASGCLGTIGGQTMPQNYEPPTQSVTCTTWTEVSYPSLPIQVSSWGEVFYPSLPTRVSSWSEVSYPSLPTQESEATASQEMSKMGVAFVNAGDGFWGSMDFQQLKWPLAFTVLFAIYAPYANPTMSVLIWSSCLHFLLAELRSLFFKGKARVTSA